jgi:hypothetical protein
MTAPVPDAPEPEQRTPPPRDSMDVERVRLDDGRALLLFSWDEDA